MLLLSRREQELFKLRLFIFRYTRRYWDKKVVSVSSFVLSQAFDFSDVIQIRPV